MVVSVQNDLAVAEPTTYATETITVRTVYYEVAHQIDGRIRLHIPRLSRDAKFAQRLMDSVRALPAVKQARVNRGAASLLVSYRKELSGARVNGNGTGANTTCLPEVVECIRVAAKADVARDMASLPQAERPAPLLPALPAGTVNTVQKLGLPVLGLGLSTAMLAGLAIPAALVGATVLAATIPHARRAVNGLREEKRLTVEILDVTTVALLVAQSSFLAPAFMIAVTEGAEVVRSWTTRRGRQVGVDLLLSQERQALVERDGQQAHVGCEEIASGDIVLVYPGDEIPVDGTVLDGSASIDQHQVTGDACACGAAIRRRCLRRHAGGRGASAHSGHAHKIRHVCRFNDGPHGGCAQAGHADQQLCAQDGQPCRGADAGGRRRHLGGLGQHGAGRRHRKPGHGPGHARLCAHRHPDGAESRRSPRYPHPQRTRNGDAGAGRHDLVRQDRYADRSCGRRHRRSVVCARRLADELVALAASAEQSLDHPIAEAIRRYAQQQGIATQTCSDWSYRPGEGLVAQVAGRVVHVGSAHLMEDIGIEVPDVVSTFSGSARWGGNACLRRAGR